MGEREGRREGGEGGVERERRKEEEKGKAVFPILPLFPTAQDSKRK